jgi:hypothetical protein
LYQLAFLKNCFEEGSNLAILSRKYTIPEDNPYGEGLVELLDRMLTVDSKQRADMTEVILCLSAVYSGRELPPRKKASKVRAETTEDSKNDDKKKEDKSQRIGTFRTDGQGIQETVYDPSKATEGKKLASNSVAARRKRAAAGTSALPPTVPSTTPSTTSATGTTEDPLTFTSFQGSSGGDDVAFGSDFGEMKGKLCARFCEEKCMRSHYLHFLQVSIQKVMILHFSGLSMMLLQRNPIRRKRLMLDLIQVHGAKTTRQLNPRPVRIRDKKQKPRLLLHLLLLLLLLLRKRQSQLEMTKSLKVQRIPRGKNDLAGGEGVMEDLDQTSPLPGWRLALRL